MSIKSTIDDLRKYRNLVLVVFLFCMVSTLSFLAASNMTRSSAASLSGFKPGNIISDAVMGNYNSMNKDEIQAFLTKKNPCNNRNASQYQNLKAQYPNLEWHFENGHFVCLSEERFGDGVAIGKGQTAAEIIYQAAQDYKINPQVLLVLLEKEQSLISDTYPNTKQYRSATGYGCPDTAACDTKYYGFKNQVRNAAALFRNVLDNGYSAYPEKKKGIYIGYNPNSSCGRSEVYIENRATAALYRYTPYQPNAAALSAGYGTGDSCSAYGNRNFYLYFVDWFGSTQVAVEGTPTLLAEGEYIFVSRLNSARTLGVASNSNNVQLSAFNDDNKNQRWNIKRVGTSEYYSLTNVATGKVLDLQDTKTIGGTNIQTWNSNGSCAQQWKPYLTPDGAITLESACMAGMVVDISGANTTVGNNVQLWMSNNGDVQKWSLRSVRILADGVYTITSKRDATKSLDVANNGIKNSTNVQLANTNQNLTQRWVLHYNDATGYYNILNAASGLYLDLVSARTNVETNIQLFEYSGVGCAQSWSINNNADGSFTFVSACANNRAADFTGTTKPIGTNVYLGEAYNAERWTIKAIPVVADGVYEVYPAASEKYALDVADAGKSNSTNIQLYSTNKSIAQEWKITRDKAGYYTVINPNSGKALDIADGIMRKNTNIQQFTPNNTCAQRWYIVDNNGAYTFLAACAPQVSLDLSDAKTANGTNIQLYVSNNATAQKWVLRRK